MAEQNLALNFRSLYPRLLSFGIGYGDLERITSRVNYWTSFARAMADLGEHWEASGDKSYKSGSLETPRQQWLRAAAYYHYAQLRLHDSLLKESLRRACRQVYAKYAPLADPTVIRCEIPFQGMNLPGYLRVRRPGGSCVILIGGLDSAKEVELHHFAEIFLNRCCSVFYFDGPGQGELYGRSSMTVGFEKAVASVLQFVTCDQRVRAGEIGCFGVSFGGYLACLPILASAPASASEDFTITGSCRSCRPLPPLPSKTLLARPPMPI